MFDWLRSAKGKQGDPQKTASGKANPAASSAAAADAAARAATLREQGNRWLDQDRFDAARECYEQAIALAPADPSAWVNLGFAELQLGRVDQAAARLRQAVVLDPGNHDAHYLLAGALEQGGDLAAAAASLERTLALKPGFLLAYGELCRVRALSGEPERASAVLAQGLALAPRSPDLHFFAGNLALANGRPEAAVACFEQVLALDAGRVAAHANLATAFERLGDHGRAEASLRTAIAREPGHPEHHKHLAAVLLARGRAADAAAAYREAVRRAPADSQAWSDLGHALRAAGQLDAGREACLQALALAPRLGAAHNNLGAILVERGELDPALAAFDQAVACEPGFAGAWTNRGAVLASMKRWAQALESHQQSLRLAPGVPEALNNLGNALLGLGRADEALAAFDQALAADPRHARALNHRGNALRSLGRHQEALASYEAAIAAAPDFAEAWNNCGNVLAHLGRPADADGSYQRAIAAKPGYAEAWFNRASLLRKAGRLPDALAAYGEALALKPGLPFLFGDWLHARMQACDWSGLAEHFEALVQRVKNEALVVNPFITVPVPLSPAEQREAIECYVRSEVTPLATTAAPVPPSSSSQASLRERIRVGYFSADFHDHATAYLMAELFERHDRTQFEFFAFSFGPPQSGGMRARLQAAFEHFLPVNDLSDREIAARAREVGLDIAVDLKGYTQNSRPGIFALRAAPVQVNYLGFPGTMGAGFIDYLVADEVVIPPASRAFYTEKIAWLPHSYQVNDGHRAIDDAPVDRAALGLPEDGFVFCCFNNSYKITPAIFDVWMRLLRDTPRSVLWLLQTHPLAVANLRAEAQARGVDAQRLVFAPHLDLPRHLARHRAADLFIDTPYCNAHTTASDALWAGLPLLTCPGEVFASRVAASLLTALDLPELIAASLADYEATARHLAADRPALAQLKAKLARNRLEQPLFDAGRFAGYLEEAYRQMHARRLGGLAPEHLAVAA